MKNIKFRRTHFMYLIRFFIDNFTLKKPKENILENDESHANTLCTETELNKVKIQTHE